MKRILELASLVLILALTGLAIEGALLLRDVRAHSVVTLENLDRNLIVLGVTLSEVQKGAKEWQIASTIQTSEVTKAMSNVRVAAASLSTFVSRTDASVNSDLLPAASLALKQQNVALLENQSALQEGFKRLSTVIADTDAQISSPAIAQSLASISDSTKQLDGISIDAKVAADLALQKERDLLNPPPEKFAVKVAKFFLGHIVDGAELYFYATH